MVRAVRGVGPCLLIGTAHEISIAQSNRLGRAEILPTTEPGRAIRIPDLPQDAEVAHRQVHQIMSDPYSARIQHEALNPVSVPLFAAGPQVASFGLPRESSVCLSSGQCDNIQQSCREQLCPTGPSLRCSQ